MREIAFVLLLMIGVFPAYAQEAGTQSASAPAAIQPANAAEDQNATGTETIVFLRHGEKPPQGLGQLTPQGLNRALALSTVLVEKFGKPDCLFAPDPQEKVTEGGSVFNYVRPLATIEPTAIRLGMPVQTPFGFREIERLNIELTDPKYEHAMIFVAWEHAYEAAAVADLVKQFGGDASKVPQWPGGDFDSLYVVKIIRMPGHATSATFTHDHEGLDHLSREMPAPAPKLAQ